ncbi:MAG: hypothetical protein AAFY42_12895 [Pseudomonadota bacterium]
MSRLTPERIEQVWVEAATRYGRDPVVNDRRASEALFRQPFDLANLPATLAAMEILREKTPAFFDAHDYDWAFKPAVWQKSLEANYQSRSFQHLSMLYRSPRRDPAWQLDKVVVRYAFQTDALTASPFHLEHDGLHFITVPFVFNETLMLLFVAFLETIGGKSCGWSALEESDNAGDRRRISPYLKHLLLRMLTTDGFHPSIPGEPPMDVVKREVAWFADAAEVEGEPGPMMNHLTMSLVDYALAHELGHRLLDHRGVTRLEDLNTRITAEIDADRVGFHLFTTSWGWRDELMDDAPLGQLARIMLGPLCFAIFERWYAGALSGLATACLKASVDPGFNLASLETRRQESEARMRATFEAVATHQAQSIAKGASFTVDDNRRIDLLTRRMVAFLGDILQQARSVPPEAVRHAREIAKPLI